MLVTSEQTTGKGDYAGLPPTLHVIYAQVTRDPDGLGRERMGAAELTRSRTSLHGAEFSRRLQSRTTTPAIWIMLAYAVLWTITLLGAVIGTIAPQLATAGRPHPTLHGSLGDIASIAGDQRPGAVRAVPARLLPLPGPPSVPSARRSADRRDPRRQRAARRTRTRPLARSPPPLRAAAAARMAGRRRRRGSLADPQDAAIERRRRWPTSQRVLVVVVAAAAVETIATPRAHTHAPNVTVGSATTTLHSPGPASERKAGGGLPALRSCAGAGARFKVASLPSPRCRSVPLGRLAGAAGLRQPPPDPAKEGPQ